MKLQLFLFCLMAFITKSRAAAIQGIVTDTETKEELIGAIVILKDTKFNTVSALDGSYMIRNIPKGNYLISVQYFGYKTQEKSIQIEDENQKIALDFSMLQSSHQLQDVEVKGEMDKETEESSRRSEKNADNVLNIMSAKTIQLLPDLSVGNVLQRVSGVSMDRSGSGEGRYAVIRGMDQRYNYTLVNGVKIPSPDNKNRYVPMDIFPADLIERLEVAKTLTPSMEGDATGGAMNLVMKNAPNQLTIKANASAGINQQAASNGFTNLDRSGIQEKSPADANGPNYTYAPTDFNWQNFNFGKTNVPINQVYGFSIGNRVLKTRKLGFIVAGSYQSLYHQINNTFFAPNSQTTNLYHPIDNYPAFNDIFKRKISTLENRMGLHAKIDYDFSKNHKISWYNMFVELDDFEYRHSVDTSLDVGRSGPGTGNTYILNRTRVTKQSIYHSHLKGEHQFSDQFSLNWSAVYSLAKNDVPNWDEYKTVQQIGLNSSGQSVVIQPQSLTNQNDPGLIRRWLRNSDRDLMGIVNFLYKDHIFGQNFEASAGALYRDKARDNTYFQYNFLTHTNSNGLVPPFDGKVTPDKFYFNNALGGNTLGGAPNPLTFTASEKIFAYYLQLKIDLLKKLELVGGLRVESTDQSYITAEDAKTFPAALGEITYSDYLPSLNTKFKINEKQNLRLSYFASINRPQLYDIVPFVYPGNNFMEYGNPYLQHTKIDNFDIRYEFFPKASDQLLIGAFYKNLTNPMELAYSKALDGLQLQNFGNATNFGIELVFAKYFGHIGISGNYTYTYSSITTNKLYYFRNASGSDVVTSVNQTRPLQGQSPHIANLSLLYKNPIIGLDMQLACVYTGKKISYVSPWLNDDYWQREMVNLDFSAEKRINKYLSIFCKLQNLLNTPVIVEIHQPNQQLPGSKQALPDQSTPNTILVTRDYFGQTYLAGLRFKL